MHMFGGVFVLCCLCVVLSSVCVVFCEVSSVSWPFHQPSFKDPYSSGIDTPPFALLDIYVDLCHPWSTTVLDDVITHTDDLQSIQVRIPSPTTPHPLNTNTGYFVGPPFTDKLIKGETTRSVGGVSVTTTTYLKVSWDGLDTLTFTGLTDGAAGTAVIPVVAYPPSPFGYWVSVTWDVPNDVFISPFPGDATSGAYIPNIENVVGKLPLLLVYLPTASTTLNPAISQILPELFAAVPKNGITNTDTTSCRGTNIVQDPIFSGFQGQVFQFHGLPDEHFNLVSSPDVQLNSHFVYLSSGKCDYNDTECWTHPGTYMNVLGFAIADDHVKLVAGTHEQGLRIWFNEQEISRGSHIKISTNVSASIKYHHNGHVEIHTPIMNFEVANSDMFMNIHLALNNRQLLRVGAQRHTVTDKNLCKTNTETHDHQLIERTVAAKYPVTTPLHGLIGQTWRNVKVCSKDWMGTVEDYLVSDLFATDYHYNYFQW